MTLAVLASSFLCAECGTSMIVGTIRPTPLPHVLIIPMWKKAHAVAAAQEPAPPMDTSVSPRCCSVDCATKWLTDNWPSGQDTMAE